jgi:hypothetical protein
LRVYANGGCADYSAAEADDPLRNEQDHFLECVFDRSIAPAVDLTQALAGLKLAHAAMESLRLNREVFLSAWGSLIPKGAAARLSGMGQAFRDGGSRWAANGFWRLSADVRSKVETVIHAFEKASLDQSRGEMQPADRHAGVDQPSEGRRGKAD